MLQQLPKWKGRTNRNNTVLLMLAAVILAGCSGGSLTTREKGAGIGAVGGAAAGGIIGTTVGHAGGGAAIGGALGLGAHALVGTTCRVKNNNSIKPISNSKINAPSIATISRFSARVRPSIDQYDR